MKTLIYGSGPIGRWLALRLHHAGVDVTLLARNTTAHDLQQNGIETPALDALLDCVPRPGQSADWEEVA